MSGKVVVITGAFGALGRVVASAFAKRGAKTVLIDEAQSPPREVEASLGRNGEWFTRVSRVSASPSGIGDGALAPYFADAPERLILEPTAQSLLS